MAAVNPYDKVVKEVKVGDKNFTYYSLPDLEDSRVETLPYCIRVLLESAVRNCGRTTVQQKDVETILDWTNSAQEQKEILFKPARVILQDFTGVPAVVDLAAMRDACKRLGGDPTKINPAVPVDLVIDHSVQVDSYGTNKALKINLEYEMERNSERFTFLKWGAKAFQNFSIVPPGAGIVHQVNLEHLGRSVFNLKEHGNPDLYKDGLLYFDSLVGTDSHTPMINGLGIIGWGVGGIEAESVTLGQAISMVLPEVIGFKLTGEMPAHTTATDLVLAITKQLRAVGVVEKFVEFFGEAVGKLSIADRATIANMSPEHGSTISFFPPDQRAIEYLKLTGRSADHVEWIENYLKAQKFFITGEESKVKYTKVIELDLSTIVPCLAGPKRPHDYVALKEMKSDFQKCLENKVGFKGFAIPEEERSKKVEFEHEGVKDSVAHGSVAIAAITSCTNTSNPNVMIAAGLVAKKAVERGLNVKKWIKTSLAPGSGVVTEYLKHSQLLPYLEQLGFNLVGYGCTTCIGNSGPLPEPVGEAIDKGNLVCCGVLSGNRNFEGRIHPQVRANYLASPPLVVSYALAGTVLIDFETQPIGQDKDGKDVFLKEIWPSHEEIEQVVAANVLSNMFIDVYKSVTNGTEEWNKLQVPADSGVLYSWTDKSTYIHFPPFFNSMTAEISPHHKFNNVRCLLLLGDSITTDHISPAGNISVNSPAARYLMSHGVQKKDFNSYGARRGNDQVMCRGTFANIRLVNELVSSKGITGPKTVHFDSGDVADIWDVAERYISDNVPLCIFAGEQYGSGSSRDWAAKGVWMQNVKFVVAKSYERIHRSNLVLFGVIPLQFIPGQDAKTIGLTGAESFDIDISSSKPGDEVEIKVTNGTVASFKAVLRFDTETELTYYNHGGVLNYVIRQNL